jgi:hypothetical protein
MVVVGEDMAVVEDTLPVIWAALVVLAWRAAESAAESAADMGRRRAIAATDTNRTVYPPPSFFELIERSPGPPGFSFDRQIQGEFEKTRT